MPIIPDQTANEDTASQLIYVERDSGFSFPCPLCRMEFSSEESLREHTDATHMEKALLNCNDCDFNTDNETILQSHTKELHKFQCNMCNYSAKNKGWLTRHINASHQTDSHDEPRQPELADNSRIGATNAVSFSCDICDFESDNREDLTTHDQTVHQKANTTNAEIETTTTKWTGPKESPPSWSCLDQHGTVHGPFSWDKMLRWYNSGGIKPKNMLKKDGDDNFATFEEIQKIYGQQPFFVLEPIN